MKKKSKKRSHQQLLLASTSPRRRELLGELGIPFEAIASDFPELSGEEAPWLTPSELVRYNAVGKAEAVQVKYPGNIILAADTVVALGTTVYGKPRDIDHARNILSQLSNRSHHVFTSLALAHPENGSASLVVSTRVKFRRLTSVRINNYLQKVQVLDKAGAYAIQEHSDEIIEAVEGSLSNVMGLPLEALARLFLESALNWHGKQLYAP